MSQYLSHLADLAFNQLDVVQPRLSGRFENQDDGVSARIREQDSYYEPPVAPVNPAQPTPVSQAPVALAGTPPAPEFHSEFEPKAPLSIERAPAEAKIQLLERVETQISFASEKPSSPYLTNEPGVPLVKPASTSPLTMEIADAGFREERLDIQTPLLQPVKLPENINQNSPQNSGFSEQIDSKVRSFRDESSRLDAQQSGREEQKIAHLVKKHEPEPAAKAASIKPESIRIKPVEPEFIREPIRAKQPFAEAPVEITPPSIHVSIGRIEIRANQTSAPAAAKSRPSSTMSLDDYAKRNGERP